MPATWRANCITVRCKALGTKRGLLGSSDVTCGMGLLSVGLYKQNDAEAMAAAYELGKKQQQFLNQLRADPKFADSGGVGSLLNGLALAKRTTKSGHAGKMDARRPSTAIGATLQAQVAEDKSLQTGLSSDTRAAAREVAAAMLALRKLNTAP